MRVGDAQREAVADYLGIAYAYGFIPRDEHDKRMNEALTARTEDHLRALLLDLPRSIGVPDAVEADYFGMDRAGLLALIFFIAGGACLFVVLPIALGISGIW